MMVFYPDEVSNCPNFLKQQVFSIRKTTFLERNNSFSCKMQTAGNFQKTIFQIFFFFIIYLMLISVSHTTEDLVFEWLPEHETPLVVDDGIELPQLELIQNFTADCTTNYSTGSFTCLEVVFRFKRRLGWVSFIFLSSSVCSAGDVASSDIFH